MDPLLIKRVFDASSATVELEPGTYYFRVRGLDDGGIPGPWSEVQGFVVNPKPPLLSKPANKSVFSDRLPSEGIQFEWEAGIDGSKYQLEIKDKRGVVVSRGVNGTEFFWMPLNPGVYSWRVGFETQGSGVEWGKPWMFLVRDRALASIQSRSEKNDEAMDDIDHGSSGDLSLIGRLAQSVAAYSVNDTQRSAQNSGAALVAFASVELRWRLPRPVGRAWLWSGSLNLEAIRQTVLGTTFVMPRGYVRLFYTRRERSRWRVGPFLHASAGQGGVFITDNTTDTVKTKVSRTGLGGGAVAVYEAAKSLHFSVLGLLRMDFGGSSSDLSNETLKSKMGFEAGFGTVLGLSPSWLLEGRLRVQQEPYSWVNKNDSNLSSYTATFVLMDIGLGYRF